MSMLLKLLKAGAKSGNAIGKAAAETSYMVGKATFGAGKKMLTNPYIGGMAITTGLSTAMYNGSNNVPFESYMAEETIKNTADIATDTAVFGITEAVVGGMVAGTIGGGPVGTAVGAAAGLAAGLATSAAMYATETNPGRFIGEMIDSARDDYRTKKYGKRYITQNKRTMQAMQRSLQMLGQSRPTTMLGQEAGYMHN